jgi:hypothetical protein
VRDARWKLIVRETGSEATEQFFDLEADPGEQDDLLPELTPEQSAACDALRAVLAGLR